MPADHKWYRNLVVGSVIIKTLEELKMSYPPLEEDLNNVVIE